MIRERGKCVRFELAAWVIVGACGALGSCASEAEPAPVPPTQEMVRQQVVTELARKLTSDYVFEDVGALMAEAVLAKLDSGAYDVPSSSQELASLLTDDLRSISNDKHLGVILSGPAVTNPGARPTSPIARVDILDGNIGYIESMGMPPIDVSRAAIADAFADVHDTDALILDNRRNGGGDPRTVAFFISYLSEGPSYVVNRFHWREGNRVEEFQTTELGELSYGQEKPVFVLTSGATFSAGEELAYDIQAQGRGLIIGEVTGGGAHPSRGVPLGHAFIAVIPFGRAVNPVTGTNWEGTGVQPDVEVPADQALMEAQRLAAEPFMMALP